MFRRTVKKFLRLEKLKRGWSLGLRGIVIAENTTRSWAMPTSLLYIPVHVPGSLSEVCYPQELKD